MLTPPPPRRRRGLVPLVAVALVASACRVDLSVGVVVAEDGSGEVRAAVVLDEEAAGHLPELGARLEVDDLVAAGWVVDGPVVGEDGGTTLAAVRHFATPEEAGLALAELTGPDGPFGDLRLRRSEALARTIYRFGGEVDLRRGIDAFADDALRERLGGTSLGVDVAELERRAGVPIADALRVELTASLPATGGRAPVARWAPRLGESLTVETASDIRNTSRLAWALGSLVAAALAVVALLAGRGRPLRWTRRTR